MRAWRTDNLGTRSFRRSKHRQLLFALHAFREDDVQLAILRRGRPIYMSPDLKGE